MDQAFGYDDNDSPGLCSLEAYPFAYHRHWFYGCSRYMPYCDPLPYTKVNKFVDVDKTEEALKAAIATQPVSVAVSAGPYDWQFYSGGVFDKGCDDPDSIDHGVLAVGYGSVDDSSGEGGDYWLVKNSWGEFRDMVSAQGTPITICCLSLLQIFVHFLFLRGKLGSKRM